METFTYLLKSTAILSLFILVYEFFLKKETLYKHHRIFLLLGIFTAAILPYFSIQKKVQIVQYIKPVSAQIPYDYTLTSYDIATAIPEKISFWQSLTYVQILFAVYLLVLVFFLVKFAFSLWKLKTFLRNQKNYTSKNGIKYIQTNENTGPFSFLKYIVYNPDLHNDNDIELILKHEEAHVKNYHSADMLLANLLVFVNWFNPFAWLYRKRISQNLEFLADQEATQNLHCPKAYQLSLLNYVQINSSHLPVNNFHKSFITTRIKKLHQLQSNKIASLKIGYILPLLTAFFLIFQVNSQTEIKYIEVDDPNSISEMENSSEDKTTAFSVEFMEVSTHEISEVQPSILAETDLKQPLDTTIISKIAISATILKTTTEASLKKIKQFLKSNTIAFNYSDLKYDKDKNLTQITMSFIDKNGKDYHYSIFGDAPIPSIQLFVSEEFTGFKTFTNADKTKSIDRSSAVILNGKPGSNFDKELKEILIATQKRSENGHPTTIASDTSNGLSYIKSLSVIKNSGKDNTGFIIINDENPKLTQKNNTRIIENKRDSLQLLHGLVNNKRDSVLITGRAVLLTDRTNPKSFNGIRIFTVDKKTSDQQFKEIKAFFTSYGIDFSSSVKRNKQGEITKVKIKTNDQNGKSTATSHENNQGIPGFKLGLKGADFFID